MKTKTKFKPYVSLYKESKRDSKSLLKESKKVLHKIRLDLKEVEDGSDIEDVVSTLDTAIDSVEKVITDIISNVGVIDGGSTVDTLISTVHDLEVEKSMTDYEDDEDDDEIEMAEETEEEDSDEDEDSENNED